ncbi:putative amidophosphoribosyltransferase, comF/gntX family [Cupriavidus taiwanensis]|uniref:ComF family protein n=1 Tax=Cupriavidus taiwanensis TaxID=164546 RepID=UPI000E121099|nr:ComF family protein [Cupriavidus taiwanensis]SPA28564.1 putative amidophosphoribosyltransferase, comF/gntX family [Cupriavidus taiwanensis]
MQGHGQTGQQGKQEPARGQALPKAPDEQGRRARWAATGRQVYARAAQAAGAAGRAWSSAREQLLPSACTLCGTVQRQVVCAPCAADLLRPVRRCPVCALALGRHFHCPACGASPRAFDHAHTLGDYASPQDQLVLALKFGHALPLAAWLAARLAEGLPGAWAAARHAAPDLIVPVPLSPQRLAARGFNQAWEIARPLARRLRLRADPVLLQRQRDTGSQRALDLAARQVNLRGAFAPTRATRLDGLHVALVDDVMTSGATLHEAAAALKTRGAARVSVIVALRTP